MLLKPLVSAAVARAVVVGMEAGGALASGGLQAALATTSTRTATGQTYHRRGRSGVQVRSMSGLHWLHERAGTITKQEIFEFMKECFMKVDTPEEHAIIMANVLAEADHRGIFSHGLNRLEMYINDVQMGSCDPYVTPQILNETAATAWVDGQNGLGPVIGTFCMNLAITKANENGIGFVVAKGSNHYGIAAWYSLMAVQSNMVGLSMTNTSPFMTPTRARQAALGTNPLCVAAPGLDDDYFCLDMATTAVAVGKIEVKKRKDEPLPKGWALDSEGESTTDAVKAMNAKSLMPLGGDEERSGYKGYGLSLMVEVLTGILADSLYGPNIRSWGSTAELANLGQCFMAINPRVFAPEFPTRMSDMMTHLRNMAPAKHGKPVLVPGDPEREHMEKVDNSKGICYNAALIEAALSVADRLNVPPPCIR